MYFFSMTLAFRCNKLIQALIFLLLGICTSAQDTIFVKKYTFEENINNVDSDGKNLIVRTANHLYLLGNDGFKDIRNFDLSGGRYTWLRTTEKDVAGFTTYNTSYISREKVVKRELLDELLPGAYHPNITEGVNGDRYYVNHRGGLLEYEIKNFYKVVHKGKSIRSVYCDDTIKLTASYSGIFKGKNALDFSENQMPGADYSSGEISKVNNKYYLCRDDIFVLESDRWIRINKPFTLESPFLKLREHGGRVFFLAQNLVGVIDLETGAVTDTIFQGRGNIRDFKWINNQMAIAAEDGNLYLQNADSTFQKIVVGSCIYDINVNGDRAILSCRDGVYEFDSKTKLASKLFELTDAIQSLYIEDDIIITSFDGLFVINNGKLYKLMPNVEFNRYALSQYDDYIFAGSIEGLYLINRGQLIHDVIPGLTPYKVEVRNASTYIYVLLISLLVLFIILYFTIRKRQKKLQVELIKRTKITPESIRELMLSNANIISVEAVAEHFATSTVQLNRILKRYDTSGLALLKDIKGEIILTMIEKQASLDQISNRVGYSIAYIKRNYLKKFS